MEAYSTDVLLGTLLMGGFGTRVRPKQGIPFTTIEKRMAQVHLNRTSQAYCVVVGHQEAWHRSQKEKECAGRRKGEGHEECRQVRVLQFWEAMPANPLSSSSHGIIESGGWPTHPFNKAESDPQSGIERLRLQGTAI